MKLNLKVDILSPMHLYVCVHVHKTLTLMSSEPLFPVKSNLLP